MGRGSIIGGVFFILYTVVLVSPAPFVVGISPSIIGQVVLAIHPGWAGEQHILRDRASS